MNGVLPVPSHPLITIFKKYFLGTIGNNTHLREYMTLFDEVEDYRKRKIKPTYTYRLNDGKQVWSITRAFPYNSFSREGAAPYVTL